MNVEVGQTWASTNPEHVQRGWNQCRRVLDVIDVERTRWKYGHDERETYTVRTAVMTCDGNGGRMRSRIGIKPNGLPGHRLVAEPDPHIKALAETFRGITTHPPYDPAAVGDLADKVYETLLWPRRPSGAENPKVELTLHQDALTAVAERLLTLVQTVEQSAWTAAETFYAEA